MQTCSSQPPFPPTAPWGKRRCAASPAFANARFGRALPDRYCRAQRRDFLDWRMAGGDGGNPCPASPAVASFAAIATAALRVGALLVCERLARHVLVDALVVWIHTRCTCDERLPRIPYSGPRDGPTQQC